MLVKCQQFLQRYPRMLPNLPHVEDSPTWFCTSQKMSQNECLHAKNYVPIEKKTGQIRRNVVTVSTRTKKNNRFCGVEGGLADALERVVDREATVVADRLRLRRLASQPSQPPNVLFEIFEFIVLFTMKREPKSHFGKAERSHRIVHNTV